MLNTFSNHFFRLTIAAGLLLGTLGAYSSLQRLSAFTQHAHTPSNLIVQLLVGSTLKGVSNRIATPVSIKFSPLPNPEPSGTGGTGTR